jgi:hypothetical protein
MRLMGVSDSTLNTSLELATSRALANLRPSRWSDVPIQWDVPRSYRRGPS